MPRVRGIGELELDPYCAPLDDIAGGSRKGVHLVLYRAPGEIMSPLARLSLGPIPQEKGVAVANAKDFRWYFYLVWGRQQEQCLSSLLP
jgi:hypothetical protein